MRWQFIPCATLFGLSMFVDRPRKLVQLTLPFLSVLIEGEREWPSGVDANVREMHVNANEFLISLEGSACAELARQFAGELDRVGAENYVALDFEHEKHGPITVTVQRKRGKTPAGLVMELKRELAALKSQT